MQNKLMKVMPWISLGALILAVLILWAYSGERRDMLREAEETLDAAVEAVGRFQGVEAESVEDSALQTLADDLVETPYIATIWLISPEGEFTYSTGSTAMQGMIEERISRDFNALLQTLPADRFSEEQILMLKTASAVRSEGEHNDVYRHIVRSIFSDNGTWLGLAAVAYDVSPQISIAPGIWEKVSLVVFGLSLLGYWFSLPMWVFLDARLRGERAWVWAVFVFLGNLMALLAYLLVRVPCSRPDMSSNDNFHNNEVEGK